MCCRVAVEPIRVIYNDSCEDAEGDGSFQLEDLEDCMRVCLQLNLLKVLYLHRLALQKWIFSFWSSLMWRSIAYLKRRWGSRECQSSDIEGIDILQIQASPFQYFQKDKKEGLGFWVGIVSVQRKVINRYQPREDMLKVSIKMRDIDPVKVYDFLKKRIGPLKMVIRQESALIRFEDEALYKTALQQSPFYFMGGNFSLTPYHQGQPIVANPESNIQQRLQVKHETQLCKKLREISESLEIKDKEDVISTLVKEYRWNMIEMIASHDLFLQAISDNFKKKGIDPLINSTHPQVTKIRAKLEKGLKQTTRKLRSGIIGLNLDMKNTKYIRTQEIEIQPLFASIQERTLDYKALKERIQYSSADESIRINKLCSLSPSQFVCSSCPTRKQNTQPKGKLKIFNIQGERQENSMNVKEGARGLLRLGNFVITGTEEGYFSLFNQKHLSLQELSPRFFGSQQEELSITEILDNSTSNRHKIIALGKNLKKKNEIKNVVKTFTVEECLIQDDSSSLIFTENQEIVFGTRQIQKIELLEQGRRLLIGCKDELLNYDLVQMKIDRQIKIQGEIHKIKRASYNIAYLGQQKQLTFLDLLSPQPAVQKYKFQSTISSLCCMNDHSLLYGTNTGQISIFDRRKQGKQMTWSNTCNHFRQRISDIIKHNQYIISADTTGQIVTWQSKEL